LPTRPEGADSRSHSLRGLALGLSATGLGVGALALRRYGSRAALTGAVLGTIALVYAGAVERRWYALRHDTLPLLRPAAARPLRILHISDLHWIPGQWHRLDFVRRCLDSGPDLIVSTGDALEHPDAIDAVVRLHADLARHAPVIAVLGAHDYWGPTYRSPVRYFFEHGKKAYGERFDTTRFVGGLREGGVQVLENRRACVDTVAGPVDVAGLGDPHVWYDRPDRIDWSPPDDQVALRLGVVHAPYRRALDVFDRHGFDLALSGHTHGGQLRLPWVGALVANCDLPVGNARGTSRHGAQLWVHVSAGLGHSRYAPLRFACRPEASILDIVPRAADAVVSRSVNGM
jgi:predicted MPP superfamily phosphohydrolase